MTAWEQDLRRHAEECAPMEACGLIVSTKDQEIYYPCRNLSTVPDYFALDPQDYLAASKHGKIVGVAHSHPNGPHGPTDGDRAQIEETKMPWWILSPEGLTVTSPSGWQAAYVGRRFLVGTMDCYTLVRDWYAREKGIFLPNVFRFDGWEKQGHNYYLDNFEALGFQRIDPRDLREGDGILLQIGADVPNHAGIYLEGGRILHHLRDRLSGAEPYGGYYRKMTTHCLRHRSLC